MKNFGLNIYKEIAEQSEDDHVYGGLSQPCITNIEPEERVEYLPIGELQNIGEEKMDCATRGPENILETKFDWLLKKNKIFPENKKWLQEKGYINEGGHITFSDAFIAINSGTTREGNSLKAPLQAIHSCGLIPKYLLPQLDSFDANHDPKRITDEMRQLGLDFLARFPMEYEKVYAIHYEELLKEDLLDVAGYAWPRPVNGVYPKVDNPPNHCFIIFGFPKYQIFDNYVDTFDGDFIKQLAPDYNFLDYGYRIKITEQKIPVKTNWFFEFFKKYFKLFS